jgi:hypothetical protein
MPSKAKTQPETFVPSESSNDSETMTMTARQEMLFTSLVTTIILLDCQAKTGCITLPSLISVSDLHMGLMSGGSASMGWKMQSIESFFIFAFVYHLCYLYVSSSSRYVLVIYDSDPRPTDRKRYILSLIILAEAVLLNCISHKHKWTNMTKNDFAYYIIVFFIFYGTIYYIYDHNLGLGALLGSLCCELFFLAFIKCLQ